QRRPVASRDPGKIRRPNVRVYDNMKDGAELSQTSGPPSIASSGTPSRPMSIDFPSDGSSAHGSSPNLQQADEENDYRVSLVNRQRSINSNAHRPKPSAAPPAPPMNNHTGMGAPPPPPPPPPPMYPGPTQNFNHAHMNNTFPASHVSMDDLPPPPPPNGVAVDISNTQKPVSVTGSVPPPPPPPPPPGPLTGNIPPAPPPPSLNQEVKQPLSPSPDTGSPAKTQPKGDGRSDLLFAIREGIPLSLTH
uniref:Formin-like protein 5-like n=1 Tax=Saccoglossus kowalevskii TaxID=10224 RepID=A0ABM0MDV7_SACKO